MMDGSVFAGILTGFLGLTFPMLLLLHSSGGKLRRSIREVKLIENPGNPPETIKELERTARSRRLARIYYLRSKRQERFIMDGFIIAIVIAFAGAIVSIFQPNSCLSSELLLGGQITVVVLSGMWLFTVAVLYFREKKRIERVEINYEIKVE